MQIEENAMKNHCTEKNIEEIRSNAQFLVDLLPGEKNINKKIFIKITDWLPLFLIRKAFASHDFSKINENTINDVKKLDCYGIFALLNKVISYVFRFDFLLFFPKFLRIIVGAITWASIVFPKVILHVRNQYGEQYAYLWDLSPEEYEKQIVGILEKLKTEQIHVILCICILFVLVNFFIYFITLYCGYLYFCKNADIFYAINHPDLFFKEKCKMEADKQNISCENF